MTSEANLVQQLKECIEQQPVILFMKGEPENPQCGFSAKASECLRESGVPFSFVDILEQPEVRRVLPDVSDWPTFPQLFIDGELIGGSDIISQMHENGELTTQLNAAIEKAKPSE